ncbi:MAG TPA: TPM domain-containing protein [Candidatus Limnocylindria bacterium]|nr:TPM domain-containing protein [Candidatus Limnocylindria bacterium]
MKLIAGLLCYLCLSTAALAVELPPLKPSLNDFGGMFPQASVEDLEHRLHRFKTETAKTVVILTVKSLEGESIENLGRRAFAALPLPVSELDNTVLLVVARTEREVGVHAGAVVRPLLPEPGASELLTAQVALYWDGLRPDLGIHGAAHHLFRVLRGDARIGSLSEEERLERTSLSGGEAGAIFALCLSPFLALFIGALWGIYATQYGVQRGTRVLMGAIFGGGTAKIVATLMSFLGAYSDSLWYFIMALAIALGALGSLTEFWMSGDWSGIPQFKGRKRKPEDHMGI